MGQAPRVSNSVRAAPARSVASAAAASAAAASAAVAASAVAAAAAAAARPRPDAPPARHASRRRSREARSVRTTIRIISQITPGTITMTTTIIRMRRTTHPGQQVPPLSAPLPGSFRAPTPMGRVVGYSFSSAIVLVGYLFLAVHHCSSRCSRWWVLSCYWGRHYGGQGVDQHPLACCPNGHTRPHQVLVGTRHVSVMAEGTPPGPAAFRRNC